eukprot:6179876-Pleurochrysis_carterae.AAC.3
MRCLGRARVGGMIKSEFAVADHYALYVTWESHPTDGEDVDLTGYVDEATSWQIYRYIHLLRRAHAIVRSMHY